jgi:hypothetical protein
LCWIGTLGSRPQVNGPAPVTPGLRMVPDHNRSTPRSPPPCHAPAYAHVIIDKSPPPGRSTQAPAKSTQVTPVRHQVTSPSTATPRPQPWAATRSHTMSPGPPTGHPLVTPRSLPKSHKITPRHTHTPGHSRVMQSQCHPRSHPCHTRSPSGHRGSPMSPQVTSSHSNHIGATWPGATGCALDLTWWWKIV